MYRRLTLQQRLEKLAGSGHVWFQPPASVRMQYPCIVFSLSRTDKKHADDRTYLLKLGYMVTVIDKNPESALAAKVGALRYCSFDRCYTKDNLYHYVFTIYD